MSPILDTSCLTWEAVCDPYLVPPMLLLSVPNYLPVTIVNAEERELQISQQVIGSFRGNLLAEEQLNNKDRKANRNLAKDQEPLAGLTLKRNLAPLAGTRD